MSLADQDRAIEFAAEENNRKHQRRNLDGRWSGLVINWNASQFDRCVVTLCFPNLCKSPADQRPVGRKNLRWYCLRLWSHAQHQSKEEFDRPEIQSSTSPNLFKFTFVGERVDTLVWFDELGNFLTVPWSLTLWVLLKKGTNFIPWNGTVPDSLHPKLGNALLQASKADCLSAAALIIALSKSVLRLIRRSYRIFNAKGMDSSIDLEEPICLPYWLLTKRPVL